MEFIARNPELSKIAKDLVEYGFNRGIIELRKYNYISPTGCIGLCAHINTGKEKDMKNGVDFYITNNTNQTIEEYMTRNSKETQIPSYIAGTRKNAACTLQNYY